MAICSIFTEKISLPLVFFLQQFSPKRQHCSCTKSFWDSRSNYQKKKKSKSLIKRCESIQWKNESFQLHSNFNLIFLSLYLLVKSSSAIFIICIQKHFQSIILQVGRTNYFLSNSFIITQLFLKLKLNQVQSLRFWTHKKCMLKCK